MTIGVEPPEPPWLTTFSKVGVYSMFAAMFAGLLLYGWRTSGGPVPALLPGLVALLGLGVLGAFVIVGTIWWVGHSRRKSG